jgi:hypothetical protein
MDLLTSTQKIWGFFWKQNHQICRHKDSSFTKITHYKLQHCNWDQAYLEILCPSTTKSKLQKDCRSHRDSKRHTKTFIWQDEKTTGVKSFNYLATKVVGLHHSTILAAKTLITTNLQCSNCWALFPLTGKWPREDLAKFGYKPDMKYKYKSFPFPLPDWCSLFDNYLTGFISIIFNHLSVFLAIFWRPNKEIWQLLSFPSPSHFWQLKPLKNCFNFKILHLNFSFWWNFAVQKKRAECSSFAHGALQHVLQLGLHFELWLNLEGGREFRQAPHQKTLVIILSNIINIINIQSWTMESCLQTILLWTSNCEWRSLYHT